MLVRIIISMRDGGAQGAKFLSGLLRITGSLVKSGFSPWSNSCAPHMCLLPSVI